MAAEDDGDDLVAGEANRCQSGTELMAGTDDGHIGGGNNFVLRVIPGALMGDVDGIAGVRAEGFGAHGTGVVGEGKVAAEGDLVPGGTGVAGSGATGVRGEGHDVGVVGSGAAGVRGSGLDWENGQPTQGGIGVDGIGTIGVRAYGLETGAEFAGRRVQARLTPHTLLAEGTRGVDPYEHELPQFGGRGLPVEAQAGSLFAAMTEPSVGDEDSECSLWFCVQTGTSENEPAMWREVLLGSKWSAIGLQR